jgi:hypothetical protein
MVTNLQEQFSLTVSISDAVLIANCIIHDAHHWEQAAKDDPENAGTYSLYAKDRNKLALKIQNAVDLHCSNYV